MAAMPTTTARDHHRRGLANSCLKAEGISCKCFIAASPGRGAQGVGETCHYIDVFARMYFLSLSRGRLATECLLAARKSTSARTFGARCGPDGWRWCNCSAPRPGWRRPAHRKSPGPARWRGAAGKIRPARAGTGGQFLQAACCATLCGNICRRLTRPPCGARMRCWSGADSRAKSSSATDQAYTNSSCRALWLMAMVAGWRKRRSVVIA